MEVVGAMASSLQIVSQCGQVTMTVIRWIESVRTVDERIDAFIHEVSTLRMTYEGLSRSLKDPSVLEAARQTNRDVGGGLWGQMSRTLRDCEATMNTIAGVLGKIQSSSNFLRPVLKQLKESLHTGELVRLREQIVMFNSSLQLPMQMITLTLQLRQQEMTTAHQLHLNEQLVLLRKGIERVEYISNGLSRPRRSQTLGSSTVVDEFSDQGWVENMERYVGTAKKFLDSASVAASTRSAASTKQHDDDSPVGNDLRRGSTFIPLTQQKLKIINAYVDDVIPPGSGAGSGTPLPSDAPSDAEPPPDTIYDSDADDDIDMQLVEVLLQNGQTELINQNYPLAEENYKEALLVSQSNNFGSQIACSTTDITLMLGECLAKQEKYDETIELLQPLAGPTSSLRVGTSVSGAPSTASSSHMEVDKGQMLAANHLLGRVYLKKADYSNAEKCSDRAFRGRKKLLGESHTKTIESVTLKIDVYKANNQSALAEAYRVKFLEPAKAPQSAVAGVTQQGIPSPQAAQPIPIVQNNSPVRQRRPTFNLTSHFRRTERPEQPPTSVPMIRNNNATASSFLVADESHHLSSSPNDTSSLHMGSDIRPIEPQIRKESTNSIGSPINLQRWATASDIDAPQSTHQRSRSSLSQPPTVYAVLTPSDLEQRFLEIATLQNDGKGNKAIDRGMTILQQYDTASAILVHRTAELKENIKKCKGRGLAGTGYGYSPLHFFCSMKYEPLVEIEILLRQGADPNAIAYKPGYGKVDPFVPLTIAVAGGHENMVRILLEYGATWQPDLMRTGLRYNSDSVHPLLQACQKGYANIVRVFLEHKIELTEDLFPRLSWHGNSLLHEACFRCDLGLVELLTNYARHKDVIHDGNYSFIGRPSQQDQFGITPIMYAVDMRDYNEDLRAYKLQNRLACLKLLLGLNKNEVPQFTGLERLDFEADAGVPRQNNSPGRLGMSLHLQDKKGDTVYWYVGGSRAEDLELIAFLDEQSQMSRLIDL